MEIFFPEGLIGCEEWQRFVLETDPESEASAPVLVLQSLDEPAVSFLVTDPRVICPDYWVDLAQAEASALGLTHPHDLAVLCILNVRQDIRPGSTLPVVSITANLLGPLVIDQASGRARQVVLANSSYSARYLVTTNDKGQNGSSLVVSRWSSTEGAPC